MRVKLGGMLSLWGQGLSHTARGWYRIATIVIHWRGSVQVGTEDPLVSYCNGFL
jgi:hypothetical protein